MGDSSTDEKVKVSPDAPVVKQPRKKAAPKAPVDPASLIPAGKLVKYQAADGKMLPVKCGGKFVFVRSDKSYAFDKSKIKHQMLIEIKKEIQAGRLKEVK